jgi:FkbM family methyltransferase
MERVVAEGSNQRPEITAALAIIRPSDTVLELGAGLGVVSTAVRKYAKASRVVVVEANPDLLPTIARTHELNSVAGIEVRNGVVMAAPAGRFVPFYKHRDVWRSSLSEEPDQPMERIEVPAFGLADVLQEVRPNVLLLDIEGGEMELFDRAASLETLRSVSVEVHPQLYGSDGVTRLTESLSRLGFVRDTQRSAGTQLIFHRTS